MINLSKSGDTIVFSFINNGHYLENGTIEVPVNSLSLVTDSSNMCTFYKADSSDIFISATYDELGKTKAEMLEWFEENMVGGGGIDSGAVQTQIDQSISGFADSVLYDSTSKYVEFYHGGTGGTKVYEFDASDFVIDGMVDDVRIENGNLVIDFNTASGKEDIQIPLTDIFDPSNYYTKTEVDGIVSGKADSSAVTQEISAAVSGKVDTSTYNTYTAATDTALASKADTSAVTESINAAVSGKADTTAVTESITQAVSGKQDTLISGTNIKTINNESILGSGNIDIQGGGVNVVQTTGTSTTDVMSQDAVTTQLNNKANKSAAVGGYKFGEINNTNYLQYINVNSSNIDSKIYYPKINGKSIFTNNLIYAQNNLNFSLVETSAITTSVNSSSTDSQVPSAKAVYDALQEGGGGGGGKAIVGGRGITVTSGETADTVSFNLPISATTNNNLIIGDISNQVNDLYNSEKSIVFGRYSKVKSYDSLVGGYYCSNEKGQSQVFGNHTKTKNITEFGCGKYNNSVSASTTFGDSGNTLFSVGNGTADNARHNAFEIRQNGDIYCSDGTNDVKLQDTITATAANTTALGGLKLVKLTQSEYDALATKDDNTVYFIGDSNGYTMKIGSANVN